MMRVAEIGVLGGSGLYALPGLENLTEHAIETPWGRPSDALFTGELGGTRVAFLARHGRGHRLLPTEVPYRANIHAMRSLGVRYLISISAVGSLREDLRPLDFVLPDQYIDLTRRRELSFFGNGAVAHVAMDRPVCDRLRGILARSFAAAGLDAETRLHDGGAYVCIEGPAFSTLAESLWYRSLGAAVIGMTGMPEAKLAREAQIAYASVSLVTDYDTWHPHEATVTTEMALANLAKNAGRAQRLLVAAIEALATERPESPAHRALDSALITQPDQMADEVRDRLALILAPNSG